MRTVFNDFYSSSLWPFTAKISYSLFRHNHIYVMFR